MTSADTRVRSLTVSWEDPMIGADMAARFDGAEFFRGIRDGTIPTPPIMRLIGFRIGTVEKGRIVFEFEPSDCHYNAIGMVHGGIPSTLLDSAASCAIHTALPAGKLYSTVQVSINFVRPITAATGPMRCEGAVIHVGGRMATAEARLFDARGKLYNHATATCLILDVSELAGRVDQVSHDRRAAAAKP